MRTKGKWKRWSEVVNGRLMEIEQVGDEVYLRSYDQNGHLTFSQTVTAREFRQGLHSRSRRQ